ncbi:MAG: DMT family transporter [Rhizobiaceae bacterium]|nr:DMT family transporter [Rhizobiaceae bacterium]
MSTSKPAPSSTLSSLIMALAAFGLFSTHDALVKLLGLDYSVFQIIFFSGLFAFVPMTVMMSADKKMGNFRPHHPWQVGIRTLASLVSMSCAFYAFTTLPLAEVYALLFVTPLLITALSVPMLGETVRMRRWIAVFVGILGMLVVLRPGYSEFSLGHLAALLAACGSALASIIVRRIGSEERTAVLIFYPMLASMLVMACILPFVYKPVELSDLGLMALIGFLVIAAQLAIIAAYRGAPAVFVAPIQYSQILWATVFGYIFFNDIPDKWVGIGAAIIIGSGLFVVWRESRENVSKKSPVLGSPNYRPDAGPSPDPMAPSASIKPRP